VQQREKDTWEEKLKLLVAIIIWRRNPLKNLKKVRNI